MSRTAVLDANVLFGAMIRDCILSVMAVGSISPRWSPLIQREWVRHLKERYPDHKSAIDETAQQMNRAFHYAMIRRDRVDAELSGLTISLPDADDLHVVACALTEHEHSI